MSKYSKYLCQLLFYGGLALCPLFFFKFQTYENINYGYFYCSIIVLIFSLTFIWKSNMVFVRLNLVDVLVCVLFMYLIAHCLFFKTSIEYIINIIVLFCVFVITKHMVSFLNKEHNIYVIIFLPFVFLSIIEALVGILQYLHIVESTSVFFWVTGTMLNPARLAGFLGITLPMILLPFFSKAEKCLPFKKIIVGFALLCVITILLTGNRSIIIGLIGGIVFYLFRTKKKQLTRKRIIALGASLILVFVGLFFVRTDSAIGRIFIWKVCITELFDKFLLGVGADNFINVYTKAQSDFIDNRTVSEKIVSLTDIVQYPYNVVLSILIEYGVFVLLILLTIIIFLIKNRSRKPSILTVHIETSLVILTIYSMFSYPDKVPSIALFCVLLSAVLNGLHQKERENSIIYLNCGLSLKIVVSLLLLGLLGFQLYSSHLHRLVNNADKMTAYEHSRGEALKIYENAYWRFSKDPIFLYKYGNNLLLNGNLQCASLVLNSAVKKMPDPYIYDLLAQTYILQSNFHKAEEILIEGIQIINGKFNLEFKLFCLYLENDQSDKATSIARSIAEKPVKIETHEIANIKKRVAEYLNQLDP